MNVTIRKPLLVLLTVLLVFAGIGVGSLGAKLLPGATTSGGSGVAHAGTLAVEQTAPLAPVGTGFTYQGSLKDGGVPVNGDYDFRFTLYADLTGGIAVGTAVVINAQPVTEGLFAVTLDFGASAFTGDARYMLIEVKEAGGPTYTALTPRQAITPAPYSLSSPWLGTSGKPAPYNPLRQPNTLTTLESTNVVGYDTSITIGADGLGLISYRDDTNDDLKVAHCNDPLCSSATTYVRDSTGNVGYDTSLTI